MASSFTTAAVPLKCLQPRPSTRVVAPSAVSLRARTPPAFSVGKKPARTCVRASAVPEPESSLGDLAAEAAELAELQRLQEENEKLLAAVAAKQVEAEPQAEVQEEAPEQAPPPPVQESTNGASSTRMKRPPEPQGPEGWIPRNDGTDVVQYDWHLENYEGHLRHRWGIYSSIKEHIDNVEGGIENFALGYEKMGFTKQEDGTIVYREWAPGAQNACLIGDFQDWDRMQGVPLSRNEFGVWSCTLPAGTIPHGSRVKIHLQGADGEWIDKIPAWIKFAVQAPDEIPYHGIYYDPPASEKYEFKHPKPKRPYAPRIYEGHVGMSSTEPKVNSYLEFAEDVLPRIKKLGYNTVQLMAIQEHAFYGSFGYHVTNFFAVSSRSGTPEEFKMLVDKAHEMGIRVIIDIVHSHASSNANDGINMFDGTNGMYFHGSEKGYHRMWDSRCFDYGQWEVMRFLLSNVSWWLKEYNLDGFRFDGVTSMMYHHHGLGMSFTGNYDEYLGMATDVDACVYLMLANDLAKKIDPECITIAEDVSGMPTLCRPVSEGGMGFDYRLAMALPDLWQKLLGGEMLHGATFSGGVSDECWDMGNITFTLHNRRYDEKTIAYAESHDQSIVGSKTIAFWLMDQEMYWNMTKTVPFTPVIARGLALHKMIRMLTFALGGDGYLNFMGNEFGHPEWIDFPREDRFDGTQGILIPGNGNSYDKCRRMFDLADRDDLWYRELGNFDRLMHELDDEWMVLANPFQYISRKDNGDKMIVFEKGPLVFVFNFHTGDSYFDYRVGCLYPGEYVMVGSSDEAEYGGFSNAIKNPEQVFHAQDFEHDGRPRSFQIYAPCRTVTVYGPKNFDKDVWASMAWSCY
mmetsp:Transcript_12640/g.46180  ORF Transcript_12640/g.46180 Transcript_12640/m.46180 type:complete len:854 (+) Transcript_12640:103-2664(+)